MCAPSIDIAIGVGGILASTIRNVRRKNLKQNKGPVELAHVEYRLERTPLFQSVSSFHLTYRAQMLNDAWRRWVVGVDRQRMQVSVVEATVHVWHTSSVGKKNWLMVGREGESAARSWDRRQNE